MFEKLLIANRGAIACRILRTLRELQVGGVAVYSEADAASLHIQQADEAFSLGEGPATQTYLVVDRILAIARASGATAIHPGYGFLSENAAFAEACDAAGIAFVGPTPEQLRVFGLKHTARALARQHGVPMLEGTELLENVAAALAAGEQVGYPVMLKSTAGGGGIGMRVCRSAEELSDAFDAVKRLGQNNFSDSGVFIEKYIQRARHLEVQVFGDGQGEVIALGVRDCSVQRRNQKVLEETPAPNLPAGMADALCAAAIKLAKAVDYRSAGTVEFVYDSEAQRFYFLEVNTRLQVEHGVTEQVWGVDLVRWMIELAAGDLPPLSELAGGLRPSGHAIQARLYAEDPGRDFQPSPGLLTAVAFPPADGKALRIDTWVEAGCEIPPYFDPMIAKLIAWAPTRAQASAALDQALADSVLYGVECNRDYLRQILADAPFASGSPWTRCLEGLVYQASTFDVLSAGTQTSVQDYPGRLGYWAVGVPPSGPMDDRALRLGNRLLGNDTAAAGLEITMSGPTLRFNCDAVVAVTGADIPLSVDGAAQPMNTALLIHAGSTLALGTIAGSGARSYLSVRGGIQVPDYLGSKSTFTLGQFGGHGGRALRAGDVLHILTLNERSAGARLPAELCPALPALRELRVIYGPHGAPEYFTPAYVDSFLATDWEVHFNSSRTGVRLIGPKPEWVRDSGGEAGLHPSNIHDNPYAIGAVDFTGDMPVILGPDGPSLGGFVCLVTIIEADLWQLGQLKAGDKVRFVPVEIATARELAKASAIECTTLRRSGFSRDIAGTPIADKSAPTSSPIVLDLGEADTRLVARLSGDTHLLLEIGQPELDLVLRFRGHALMQALEAKRLDGVIDLTPGIRSLQLHYQPETLPLQTLLDIVAGEWDAVCAARDLQVPSRIVHLPLSWDDPACQLAIEKYMTTVRKDAPGARATWSSSAASTTCRTSTRCIAPYSTPATWSWAWATSTWGPPWPRRSIHVIAWSPPSTTRHAPGRRRIRWASAAPTCACTAWKAPAATSSSAVPCRCGTATARSRPSTASPGCCASSTRSASTRYRPPSCCASAATFRSAASTCASSTANWRWPTTSSSSRMRPMASPPSATSSVQPSTPSGSAGSTVARRISRSRKPHRSRRKTLRSASVSTPSKATWPATSGRCRSAKAHRFRQVTCW